LTIRRLRLLAALTACTAAALTLAGCGRYGPLDPPPSAAAPAVPAAAASAPAPTPVSPSAALINPNMPQQADPQKTGFDANGNPVAPAGPKRDFLLDFLLQ
jgi:predicted small lipoprotein YifL